MPAIDRTLQRLDRLEKGQRELKAQVEESMGRAVDVLEAHSRHLERMEDALIDNAEPDNSNNRTDLVVDVIDRFPAR